jgi:hypothetical protein
MNTRNPQGKTVRSQLVAFAAIGLLGAMSAQAWGPAVHSYVADQVNKKAGWKNVYEMYGGMAPDTINYMFFSPDLPLMYGATHFNFAALFDAAETPAEQALSLGFVTHNMAWGADYTAHTGSASLDPTRGYVIQKALILVEILKQDPNYASLGIPDAITLEICHPMVESAVDLLMMSKDPAIGRKMAGAAQERSGAFPQLLAKAYAGPFAQYFGGSEQAAEEALIQAEAVFRQIVIEQGMAFQQDFPEALDLIADQNTAMAEGFLSQLGVVLPEGFAVKSLIVNLIGGGIMLCQEDFETEIDATVDAVRMNLEAQGYRCPQN